MIAITPRTSVEMKSVSMTASAELEVATFIETSEPCALFLRCLRGPHSEPCRANRIVAAVTPTRTNVDSLRAPGQ